jgi:ribose transport system ATP-binding protein/rhamnose transport system ATP-binding protein
MAMFLEVESLRKRFGGVQALKGVSFALEAGEIHAVMGANGAGKSTMARVIMGHIRPDAGTMTLLDKPVVFRSPREAIASGIAMVSQQLSLAPDLTVAENILLPELSKPGRLKRALLRSRAAEVLYSLTDEARIRLDKRTGELSTSHRQIVEIAKALALDARIIIFDEPTTSLTPYEVERLFDIMSGLASAGKGLVYVSHRMEEIFAICDRVTVLRDGANVGGAIRVKDLDQAELVRRMIGRELGSDVYHRGRRVSGSDSQHVERKQEPVLEVRRLKVPPVVQDVTFSLQPGEILGLAGLVGAGRTETARSFFGLERLSAGKMFVDGKPFIPKNPAHAMRNGLVLIPGDRQRQGLIPHFSVQENALLSGMALRKTPFTSYGKYLPELKDLLHILDLSEDYLESNVLTLSGGMQQKVVIARGILLKPRVLVVDEPTQGVDIGTRSQIYALLRDMAAKGIAVLFISSDFKEVLGISDRILVMTEGRIAADIHNKDLDEEKLGMFAAPRSSADSTYRILVELTRSFSAVAYWIYVDQDRLYCFSKLSERCTTETGFEAGQVIPLKETCIPKALAAQCDSWVEDDGICTLLVPIKSKRGQSMGSVGITMPGSADNAPEIGTVASIIGSNL